MWYCWFISPFFCLLWFQWEFHVISSYFMCCCVDFIFLKNILVISIEPLTAFFNSMEVYLLRCHHTLAYEHSEFLLSSVMLFVIHVASPHSHQCTAHIVPVSILLLDQLWMKRERCHPYSFFDTDTLISINFLLCEVLTNISCGMCPLLTNSPGFYLREYFSLIFF